MVMNSPALRQSTFSQAAVCLASTECLQQSADFQDNADQFFLPGYVCTVTQAFAATNEKSYPQFRLSLLTTCQGKYNEKYIAILEEERTDNFIKGIQSVVDSALAVFKVERDEPTIDRLDF